MNCLNSIKLLEDTLGQPVPDYRRRWTRRVGISWPGVIAAVGNGDGKDGARYQGNRRKLFQGRAIAVVRASKQSGLIQLTGTIAVVGSGVVDDSG